MDLNRLYRPQLAETVTGKWVKVPYDFEKSTCLIELPQGMMMSVMATRGQIDLYTADSDGFYAWSGSLDLLASFRPIKLPVDASSRS